MNESRHRYASEPAYMTASRHTYEWVVPQIWMSHVTHTNESPHTYKRVTSHISEWVVSQIRTSHVTHLNKPCRTQPTQWVFGQHIKLFVQITGVYTYTQFGKDYRVDYRALLGGIRTHNHTTNTVLYDVTRHNHVLHLRVVSHTQMKEQQRAMSQSAWETCQYGVALVSRIDKMIGLFCKRGL